MNEVLTTKHRLKLLEERVLKLEAEVNALKATEPNPPPRPPLNYG
jgi:BMFP domain-containing protein YqiC